METPDAGRAAAIAFDFPAGEAESNSTAPRLPSRIRKRLAEDCNKTPPSVEEIEAKLRHADLRRQRFYENVSNKARPKPRSPPHSSCQDEDLGQRLEARLLAAEQKRLSILAKAQMRLARLDELRQAAKTGAEMRYERERKKLVRDVESREQKAEANRKLILKAYNQRRETLRERSSQSRLRRIARESKYKERVRAAIHQKRAAAESKRQGYLEAEKKRAHARVLQVRHVAKSVSHQREIERRMMKDKLEDKLQRAKRQRAEFLRQRVGQRHSVAVNWKNMPTEADLLSQKLSRCWRRFVCLRKTTWDLAKAYDDLKINEGNVKSLPFEQLAILIESPTTLKVVKALLDRLEDRFKISRAIAANSSCTSENIDHLLKRVATPRRRTTPSASASGREGKKMISSRIAARTSAKLSRYPVRVVLSAYMILGHPDAVLSSQGEQEIALNKSAGEFVRQLELLIKIILEGPMGVFDEAPDGLVRKRQTLRSQLAIFDKAWCSYLNCFVVWKVKDARVLEDDLVRAACQLELSMIQKCKVTAEGDGTVLTHDMKAIQKQVTEDQKLLREKIQHLSGDPGIERMESALLETRSKYFRSRESGSPIRSPISCFLSVSPSGSPAIPAARSSAHTDNLVEKPRSVVRSLFKEDKKAPPEGSRFLSFGGTSLDVPGAENELIVNEYLHDQHPLVVGTSDAMEGDGSIKAKIRETMEKAFWDSIVESVKEDKLESDRLIQLVREVRDELCEMAPESSKSEITEAFDLEVLFQLLESGSMDVDYLAKMLEFALSSLQKFSAPANEEEMKKSHQKLLNELVEICQAENESANVRAVAMVRGIRFVLEQIQALKREISIVKIRIMEPLLKGPAGFDYLRQAFIKRYGSPSEASSSLPLTLRWLSSVSSCKNQEWEEHKNILTFLTSREGSSHLSVPSTSLKTGGNFMIAANIPSLSSGTVTGHQQPQPECKGEKVDLSVRLGLLKLVTAVSGIMPDSLPETFRLSFTRLRAVQAEIQKIVVVSTGILVCRQILVSEKLVRSPIEMEAIAVKCGEELFKLLDRSENAGIKEIAEMISAFLEGNEHEAAAESPQLQLRKELAARLVARSLQAGDPVFEKVSRAVYMAARGAVLGGTVGGLGKKLVGAALGQVGAASGVERVMDAAQVLLVASRVSHSLHAPWYENLMKNNNL